MERAEEQEEAIVKTDDVEVLKERLLSVLETLQRSVGLIADQAERIRELEIENAKGKDVIRQQEAMIDRLSKMAADVTRGPST